uniref:Uncharacterized protein n=1 Tax=Aegilops tauschii subsp. strangulata TaxID=200361 RepID=A0A453MY54_AEGTS
FLSDYVPCCRAGDLDVESMLMSHVECFFVVQFYLFLVLFVSDSTEMRPVLFCYWPWYAFFLFSLYD